MRDRNIHQLTLHHLVLAAKTWPLPQSHNAFSSQPLLFSLSLTYAARSMPLGQFDCRGAGIDLCCGIKPGCHDHTSQKVVAERGSTPNHIALNCYKDEAEGMPFDNRR